MTILVHNKKYCVKIVKNAAELFGDEYKRIKKEMRESRICNYDDTGQRVDGKNRWLWAFVSKEAVLYLTSKNRGKKVVISERVYADFVERLEKFVTQKRKWNHRAVKKLAKRALKYRDELFTFVLVSRVDPTNNVAERALRQGVRQRKIWGCFRTKNGAKNRDIMMSAMGTMKIMKKKLLQLRKGIYPQQIKLKKVNRYVTI